MTKKLVTKKVVYSLEYTLAAPPMQDRPRRHVRCLAELAGLLLLSLAAGCSGAETFTGPGPTVILPPGGDNILLAAGDIGDCTLPGAERTGRLLDGLSGTILALGDLAYTHGTRENFAECYHPHWGRHRDRTMPVPGNHEYETPGAMAYFNYFGQNAGVPGQGYYTFSRGGWFIIALNSEVPMAEASAQLTWLRGQLAASGARCTLAYWHRPIFSSGPNRNQPDVRPLFRALYDAGADVVLAGHEHSYERFAPQDPDGRADPARGIRQFVVGTGGARLSPAFGAGQPNSEARGSEWGLLALTLSGAGYQWEFIPVDGGAFRDAGSGQCH